MFKIFNALIFHQVTYSENFLLSVCRQPHPITDCGTDGHGLIIQLLYVCKWLCYCINTTITNTWHTFGCVCL